MVSCHSSIRRKNSIWNVVKSIKSFAASSPRLFKVFITVFAIGAATLLLSFTPQVRATIRALGFVPQVLPNVPAKPAEWFTDTPERKEVTYPLRDGGTGTADLYVPAGGGEHSAIMFFLGVNPAGKNDERVVNVANAIARSGIVVMIPWSERMAERRVTDQEAR